MMKVKIFYIGLIVTISIALLYLWKSNKSNYERNAFQRKLINTKIKLSGVISLPTTHMFVGKPDKYILLANYKDKTHLHRTNYSLNNLDTLKLGITKELKTVTNIYRGTYKQSIYLTNPFSEIVKINGDTINKFTVPKLRFDFFYPISENTLIARTRKIVNKEKDRQLVKLDLRKNTVISRRYTIPKQVDGIFSNDGWLYYDNVHSRIFYMYFYFGEFLCLDTNLILKYKAKTIDTVRRAQIKASIISYKTNKGIRKNQITQSTPQELTNRYLSTDKDRIYVLSGLKSDNESVSSYEKNQPIDVYSISNGAYLHSFYIPKYKRKRLNYFEIKENIIFAIYGKDLVTYTFEEQ